MGGVLVESAPDVNGDGKVLIGVISSGDVTDKGYYQAVVDSAKAFADQKGWADPIVVGSVQPANAAQAIKQLCLQHPDIIVVGTPLDLADGMSVSEDPDCKAIAFYAQGVDGVKVTDYIANAGDNRYEILYTAGVAAGELLKQSGSTKAGFLTGPEAPFLKEYAKAYELGIQTIVPNAEVVVTYTGDFNDSAKAVEGMKSQAAAGATVVYPFLGAATNAAYKQAIADGVATLTPGTNRCKDTTAQPAVAVAFDPGLYLQPMLEKFAAGQFAEGTTTVFRLGVDKVPYVAFCGDNPAGQAAVDAAVKQIVSGEIDPKELTQKALAG